MAGSTGVGQPCTAIDLEAAIFAFVAEDGQSTLALPSLSPEQRKQAKQLADRQPGLRCESYGFGADRQLHIFKEGALERPASRARAAAAPSLPDQGLSRKPEADDHASGAGDGAESTRSAVLRRFGAQKPPGLATPVGPLEVRRTFIHFEDPEKETEPRQIQSMPPGVFQNALLAEAAALGQKAAEAAPPSAPPGAAGPVLLGATVPPPPVPKVSVIEKRFSPGTPVEIVGLSKCPAFNGRHGRVGDFDEESGRYNIILSSTAGEEQWAKVKHENLALARALPPPEVVQVMVAPVQHQAAPAAAAHFWGQAPEAR